VEQPRRQRDRVVVRAGSEPLALATDVHGHLDIEVVGRIHTPSRRSA